MLNLVRLQQQKHSRDWLRIRSTASIGWINVYLGMAGSNARSDESVLRDGRRYFIQKHLIL